MDALRESHPFNASADIILSHPVNDIYIVSFTGVMAKSREAPNSTDAEHPHADSPAAPDRPTARFLDRSACNRPQNTQPIARSISQSTTSVIEG